MNCKLVIMHKLYEIISRTWLRLLSATSDVRARLSLKATAWARPSMARALVSIAIRYEPIFAQFEFQSQICGVVILYPVRQREYECTSTVQLEDSL